MPLATAAKDKAGVPQYANRPATTQSRLPPRSLTPQPHAGRDRSLQRQDENRRKSQGPVNDKVNNAPPTREEAAAMKLEVPDTRQKSKLAQVTIVKDVQQPQRAQANIFTGTFDATDNYRSVCALLP